MSGGPVVPGERIELPTNGLQNGLRLLIAGFFARVSRSCRVQKVLRSLLVRSGKNSSVSPSDIRWSGEEEPFGLLKLGAVVAAGEQMGVEIGGQVDR